MLCVPHSIARKKLDITLVHASVFHIQKSFVSVLWCVYICVHAHWRLVVSISIFHVSVWDTASYKTWDFSILPDCLDKELARLHFPVLMVQVSTAVPDFTCMLGNWTRLLLLAKQTLYLLSHLSVLFLYGRYSPFFFLEEDPSKSHKPIRTRARRFLNPAAVWVHTLCQPSRRPVDVDA